MPLNHQIVVELFVDPDFSELVANLDPDMKYDNLEEYAPVKWGFFEERFEMTKDSLKEVNHLIKNNFVVNVTGEDDTNFSFVGVKPQYADLLCWVLDSIDYRWEPKEDFDPENYESYIESEKDQERIYDD
jgi:hypothetical protein